MERSHDPAPRCSEATTKRSEALARRSSEGPTASGAPARRSSEGYPHVLERTEPPAPTAEPFRVTRNETTYPCSVRAERPEQHPSLSERSERFGRGGPRGGAKRRART